MLKEKKRINNSDRKVKVLFHLIFSLCFSFTAMNAFAAISHLFFITCWIIKRIVLYLASPTSHFYFCLAAAVTTQSDQIGMKIAILAIFKTQIVTQILLFLILGLIFYDLNMQ